MSYSLAVIRENSSSLSIQRNALSRDQVILPRLICNISGNTVVNPSATNDYIRKGNIMIKPSVIEKQFYL